MVVTLEKTELQAMLDQAGKNGAMQMFNDITLYHLKDAANLLGISYNTLQQRIREGKIKPVDGRITGAEISRYLKVK
ncbi:hypothetical protein TKWG_14155 [Advenella kashmirensis WT001]|uniref:Helix-turn-helix domain-containing protein n=1 Tax=Advenella kashmirensis (strain DSM 17095 / LMG 22695 / WT001) TaxID=1036672 RepID=I3UD21_ADVKW|nr:helix-turn-helix domain-containing protein [Advenella kashmirensis]AFK62909.1 hypothetical protein TKWG_14155 [Advenella kashmirensis WT001]